MMRWYNFASLALAVGLFATLPASAQPGPRDGSGRGDSVKEIEYQLTKLRGHLKALEAKLASAKEKAKPAPKRGRGQAEKGKRGGPKHDFGGKRGEKGRPGFGGKRGEKGRPGFGSKGWPGFGSKRGPTHGFGRMQGWAHGFGHFRGHEGKSRPGSMSGPRGPVRGRSGQAEKAKPAAKAPADLKGTIRSRGIGGAGSSSIGGGAGSSSASSSSRPNAGMRGGAAADLEKKLEQLQRDLAEIRRELRKR